MNIGAGYSISINQVKHFLDDLKAGRIVDHATLGATVRTGVDRQVLIDGILEHSDAYRRGLREDDEVVSFAGRPIGSVNQFKNILGIYPDRWSLPLVYRRDGQKYEIIVELRPLHRATELKRAVAMNPMKPQRRKPGPKSPEGESVESKLSVDELPEDFKKMYVEKPGFANYYFNELEQRRVLQGLESLKSWLEMKGRWKLSGKTTAGDSFTLTVTDKGLGLELPNRPGLQTFDDQIAYLDEPPGSGGLLPAVHQWKQMLTVGPESFTELVYLGSQPIDGNGESVDVLQTRLSGAVCRWFFDKRTGALVGFDTRLSTDVDACKIRFLEWSQFQGHQFPSSWQVRSGDTEFATFIIESFEAAKASVAEAGGGTN
ncbi:MAG: hypothetical protein FJ267_10325 [Planctomycetes bacterium]|nr:hypothetical protein [Planctomycetota bacterium]